MARLAVDLPWIAKYVNTGIVIILLLFGYLGTIISSNFHIGTAIFLFLFLMNFYYRHIQTKHALLRNFGIIAQARYMIESVGPELRQYLYANDVEEKPFSRAERAEVYRKAKNIDSSEAFGSLLNFDDEEIKLRHSMYPIDKKDMEKYSLTFGEERDIKNKYTITKPFIASAMSFGALGQNAVRAISRGVKAAGIPMNTGEGGYPKYHLMEGSDLIFQIGTAKFGVRNPDGSLNGDKLRNLSKLPQIKMIEIKFSQGAKPGKGGLLPKEKITEEIADLRHVPMGQDVISPPHHIECTNPKNTVEFIKRVQDFSDLPVGIKMCVGSELEFRTLIKEMKKQKIFPDYISIDGAEGGTGAAPKSFMDNVGVPLFRALPLVQKILVEERVRNKLKLLCAGKLISPGKQITAMALGADAVYTARGFLLSLGCIQALQCNKNTCPVGITTHNPRFQKGLIISDKAVKVTNYVNNLEHDFYELLASTGSKNVKELTPDKVYIPKNAPCVEK
ncbi:FMN-binding glutamate synthase family protein [Candidatus Woesearchaeota archaeon]|nr:FMN-binding glutamate synthase family protein [Candidatus Woesearchaeota archaeon]MBT5215443.1 FMN-binding glutamate synthase family protein [Candidatus Woesearchaeota archaeon]MBT6402643.1 FMN-binding glutamate synthase family protein [Candidatus Woesearchaeota archaeon]